MVFTMNFFNLMIHSSQSVEPAYVAMWVVIALFIATSITFFILSYIFYKKKQSTQWGSPTVSGHDFKSWWAKNRAIFCFYLGVLFLMLAIGGIIFVVQGSSMEIKTL